MSGAKLCVRRSILFYKFHSFTLKCLAFLVVWFIIEAVTHYSTHLISERTGSALP